MSLFTFNLWAQEVVTQTVGLVQNHVVTSREVQMDYAIEVALSENSKDKKKTQYKWEDLKNIKSSLFQSALTKVLLDWVIYLEAQSFAVANLSSGEVAEAKARVTQCLTVQPQWQKLEVEDAELNQHIDRKLRAQKFIRFKTESTEVSVTDTETKDYFEKNRSKFGSLPYTAFQDNIRAYLGRQQLDSRLREWFEVLKRKYNVKNISIESRPSSPAEAGS